jgi:DNA adenine methylase
MGGDGVKPLRPVLRYHGGKAILREWILGFFPPHENYVEPFAGAASVFMAKPRVNHEVLNDLDGAICNVFRVLRDPKTAAQLKRLCELTPFARDEFKAANVLKGSAVERARRTAVRAYLGFGSDSTTGSSTGFRANSAQNNRAAARDWQNWPSVIPAFVDRLRGVVIEQRPAIEVIRQQDSPHTLFYCDPPYLHGTRSTKTGRAHAYRHEMSDDDHRELAAILRDCAGMVIISGYACDLYADLYGDWKRVDRATFADGARPRVESLWLSPNAWAAAPQSALFLTPKKGATA